MRKKSYLRKFESFNNTSDDRIEDNIKDIFVGYQDSHELDVFVGKGHLPMNIAIDNVIGVTLFSQRGIRFDDISSELGMLIDYMKSLNNKVKIYGRLDKHVLFHWSSIKNNFGGCHNTFELLFVDVT